MHEFLDYFFYRIKSNKQIELNEVVVISSISKRGKFYEARKRLALYGFKDFMIMLFIILKNKFLSIFAFFCNYNKCFSLNNVFNKYNLNKISDVNINSQKFIDYIKKESIDIIISVAAPIIFNKKLLSSPNKFCINYHTALLPKYRGRMPLFWALLNDEIETGVTIHIMDEKIDNGYILGQKKIIIDKNDTLHNLYEKSIKSGAELLSNILYKIVNGTCKKQKNDSKKATYYTTPNKLDSQKFRNAEKKFF